MTIEFYHKPASPPCRAVALALKGLNLDHKVHMVDSFNNEHLSENYVKLNPQHTFPMLIDGDFAIWDSHAINVYLAETYGKNDLLYPTDPKQRAIINQRLFFECGVLFTPLRNLVREIVVYKTANTVNENQINSLKEAYEFVEKFLSRGTLYIASDHITIADYSFVTTLSTINVLVPELKETESYPLTVSYLKRCETTMPGYDEINNYGVKKCDQMFKSVGFLPRK